MNDFEKAKVGFALALLGTVFTVHPIIAPALGFLLPLPFVDVQLRWLYLAFVGLLVISVYCFALDMVSGLPTSRLRSIGTTLYAIALVIPILAGGLSLLAGLVRWLGENQEAVSAAATVIATAAAFVSGVMAFRLRRTIVKRDEEARERLAVIEEANHVARAQQMFSLGHLDLAAIDAWRAVEVAVTSALYRKQPMIPVAVQAHAQLSQALHLGIIPSEFAERTQWLRRLRNQAAHGGGSINERDAELAVKTAVAVLGAIERPALEQGDA